MKRALLLLMLALFGVMPLSAWAQAPAAAPAPAPVQSQWLIGDETRNVLVVSVGAVFGVAVASAIFENLAAPGAALAASGIGPVGVLVSAGLGGLFGNWLGSKF